MSDVLSWLQKYYLSLCDGDWEHSYGFKIDNLDNPGWMVHFDLRDTPMEQVSFDAVKIERSDNDWIHCKVAEGKFSGACGPLNLTELLAVFREWVEKRGLRGL